MKQLAYLFLLLIFVSCAGTMHNPSKVGTFPPTADVQKRAREYWFSNNPSALIDMIHNEGHYYDWGCGFKDSYKFEGLDIGNGFVITAPDRGFNKVVLQNYDVLNLSECNSVENKFKITLDDYHNKIERFNFDRIDKWYPYIPAFDAPSFKSICSYGGDTPCVITKKENGILEILPATPEALLASIPPFSSEDNEKKIINKIYQEIREKNERISKEEKGKKLWENSFEGKVEKAGCTLYRTPYRFIKSLGKGNILAEAQLSFPTGRCQHFGDASMGSGCIQPEYDQKLTTFVIHQEANIIPEAAFRKGNVFYWNMFQSRHSQSNDVFISKECAEYSRSIK